MYLLSIWLWYTTSYQHCLKDPEQRFDSDSPPFVCLCLDLVNMISLKQSYNYTTSNYSTQNSKGWNKNNQSETYLHTYIYIYIYCSLSHILLYWTLFPSYKALMHFSFGKTSSSIHWTFPKMKFYWLKKIQDISLVLTYLKFDYWMGPDLFILKLIACGFWYGGDISLYKVTDIMIDMMYPFWQSEKTIMDTWNGDY